VNVPDVVQQESVPIENASTSEAVIVGEVATGTADVFDVVSPEPEPEPEPVPSYNPAMEKQEIASEVLTIPGGQCFAPSTEQIVELENSVNVDIGNESSSESNLDIITVPDVESIKPVQTPSVEPVAEPSANPSVESPSEPSVAPSAEPSSESNVVPSADQGSRSGAEPVGEVSVFRRLINSAQNLLAYFKSGEFIESDTVNADTAIQAEPGIISTSSMSEVIEPVFEKQSLVYSDFSLPADYEEADINNVQLRLSLSALSNKQKDALVFEYKIGNAGEWLVLSDFTINNPISNANNGGYFLIGMPVFSDWRDINNLQIRVSYKSSDKQIVEQKT